MTESLGKFPRPLPDVILDVMYEHPERFGHLAKEEYVRILIEDIRTYKAAIGWAVPAVTLAATMADAAGTAFVQIDRDEEGNLRARALDPDRISISVQT